MEASSLRCLSFLTLTSQKQDPFRSLPNEILNPPPSVPLPGGPPVPGPDDEVLGRGRPVRCSAVLSVTK